MLVLEPPFNTWISVGGPIFSLGDFTLFPGQGYFGSSGEYELWRSDGTDAGTFSLGVSLPDNWSLRETSAVRGGVLLFANSTPGHGEELWRSDGTPAGTFLLVETVAGPDSKPLGPFATAGATVFFVAGGAELWKNDAGGTSLVRALPGIPRSESARSPRSETGFTSRTTTAPTAASCG